MEIMNEIIETIDQIKELIRSEIKTKDGVKLLSSNEVAKKLSISRTYLEKKMMYKKDFPKPVQLVRGGHKRWIESEIDDYILSLKESY